MYLRLLVKSNYSQISKLFSILDGMAAHQEVSHQTRGNSAIFFFLINALIKLRHGARENYILCV